jgi:tetratricopeptide (TPR) repeat protein
MVSMKKNLARVPKSQKDRTRNDKGILLEQIVAMLHKDEGVKVETNVDLPPKSGDKSRTREIDVLLTRDVAGYPVRVAIQCKNYGKPITVGQIGEFKDLLEDVGIPYQYGIIVSVNGYQSGAIKRAKELGIKTLVLEGLDKTRLKAEIQDTFQFFVYLLLVIEKTHIRTEIPDGNLAFWFWDEDKEICGWFTDLIVSRWRNGEIPMKLGEYSIDLKLPQGWHQVLNDNFVYPSLMSAEVRVVAYLAEMSGKVEEFKLKEAHTNKIKKFHLKADFDVLNNLIKSSHEEPIFTEEELKKSKRDVKTSVENRIRLPKIFVRNHLEPMSEKAFNVFMEGTENLTLEEIEKLPQPTFEEVEGNTFASMQERAVMGEPVIIDDGSGKMIDVRLLTKKRRFDKVIELFPYLAKFPRKDFAEYLTEAFLSQGETLLKKSLSEEAGIKKALEEQAFNLFDRAIKISPNIIDTHISLGVIFGVNGLYEKAIQCFDRVISAQPQNAMARYNLAQTLLKMRKSAEALDTVNKAIEVIKEVQPELHLLRAKLFKKEEKYQEATADLITVWSIDYKEIIGNKRSHKLVLDVFNNYKVLGTAIILSDIYLYYVRKLAEENSLDESKSYLDTVASLLEDIYQSIKGGKHDDFFESSFNPVLSRAENLVSEVGLIYPTSLWKARLESLRT